MMDDSPEKSKKTDRININSHQIRLFFLDHLNKIYAVKKHLVTSLPKLAEEVEYQDLYEAICDTVNDVDKQVVRMELIFALLDAEVSVDASEDVASLANYGFEAIRLHGSEPVLRDLSIIFYMQNLESLEMASFRILQIAAVKLKNKQVGQLLMENYMEAKADRTLMRLLAAKYVTSGEE